MANFEHTLDELFHARGSRARCSTSDAARASSYIAGQSVWATARVVGIDLEEESIQAGWAERKAPNLEYRIMCGGGPSVRRRTSSTWRARSRCSSAYPTQSARSRRWRAAPSATCSSRYRASRCGGC